MGDGRTARFVGNARRCPAALSFLFCACIADSGERGRDASDDAGIGLEEAGFADSLAAAAADQGQDDVDAPLDAPTEEPISGDGGSDATSYEGSDATPDVLDAASAVLDAGDAATEDPTRPDGAAPGVDGGSDGAADDGMASVWPRAEAGIAQGGAEAGLVGTGDAGLPRCASGEACRVGFVPAPRRRDMVYDQRRGVLYVTVGGMADEPGAVLRWDIARAAFLDPLLTGGNFLGIDLSPDESMLAVADADHSATSNWVRLVKLDTGAQIKLTSTLEYLEGGTYMPLFLDDATLLVSSNFRGSGSVPLRRITLDGATTHVATINQASMLAASADRSVVAFAESNSSDGPVGWYEVASGQLRKTFMHAFLREVCIGRDGGQVAVPSLYEMVVHDQALDRIARIGSSSTAAPIGCVYSPVADLIYLAWRISEFEQASVNAYDAHTFARAYAVDPLPDLFGGVFSDDNEPGYPAFGAGRLRISRDGSLLFACVTGGVAVYRIEPGP